MCYGAECWALRKEEVTRLRMAEMRDGKDDVWQDIEG